AAGQFVTGLEDHAERPFQFLFKQDPRYALANQLDYLLYRAEQERTLRASPCIGLLDGGLDLDYHGFTRLFHSRGLLTDPELNLCRRFYEHTRALLPPPELIIALDASEKTISQRLAVRNRINIASEKDADLFNLFMNEWLSTIPSACLLQLDVSNETSEYADSIPRILSAIQNRLTQL
ncbi:MAG: deoxynucleoside kinase, partial [Anaerolineales bacterium]|nr:deoxynucleoside kinase [Anaerolineales bacterium]